MTRPLKNTETEQCAQAIAAVIHDSAARQKLFADFCSANPHLKRWEAMALGDRARWLARQKEEAPCE